MPKSKKVFPKKKEPSPKPRGFNKFLGVMSFLFFLIILLLGYLLYLKVIEEAAVLDDSNNLKSYLTGLDGQLKTCQGDLDTISNNFDQFKKSLGEKLSGNSFNIFTARNGDQVGDLKIKSISPFSTTGPNEEDNVLSENNYSISFDGTITVSANYRYDKGQTSAEDRLCLVKIDADSQKNMPAPMGQLSDTPICFSNTSEAFQKLGNSLGGHATFQIDQLTLNYHTVDDVSAARLLKVISAK